MPKWEWSGIKKKNRYTILGVLGSEKSERLILAGHKNMQIAIVTLITRLAIEPTKWKWKLNFNFGNEQSHCLGKLVNSVRCMDPHVCNVISYYGWLYIIIIWVTFTLSENRMFGLVCLLIQIMRNWNRWSSASQFSR